MPSPRSPKPSLRWYRADGARPIVLSPEEQLAFWLSLNRAPELTESQRRLGAIMRGEDGRPVGLEAPGAPIP